jgi:hypothetical protein
MRTIITFIFLFCATSMLAQQKVALHSQGITTIFAGVNPFNDAYTAAQNGDTIYLPGGNLPFPGTIDKGVFIFGAGHFPDSTIATYPTVLNGSITINGNADNLHLEGVDLTGTLSFGANQQSNDVVIRRCRLGGITYNGTGTTPCLNNQISENVIIGMLTLNNMRASVVSNNIIQDRISGGIEVGISNNIFLYNHWGTAFPLNNVDNSFISNNIFMRSSSYADYIHTSCDLNTFSNNVFANNPGAANNIFENNHLFTDVATLFVNQTGATFNYAHDYHLNSPGTYLGTDATQVGIYGGLFPFKTGSVPVNPHIQTKSIAPQTNTNGELQIQFKVGAQNE